MIKNRYFNIIINILFVILIVVVLNLMYKYFIEKNVYKNMDFLTFSINKMEDYNMAKNCTENYLFNSKYDYYNVGYFLHNDNKEKNKKYGEYLSNQSIAIELTNVKKSIGNVYVVYYKINSETDKINRIVFKTGGNKYQVLYDSIYESLEV